MRLLSRHGPAERQVTLPESQEGSPMNVPPKAQKLLGERPRVFNNVEEGFAGNRDLVEREAVPIPPKAQKLLGEKVRLKQNSKSRDMKHSDPDSFWRVRDAEQKSAGGVPRSEADSDTIPGAKRGAPRPTVRMPVNGGAVSASTPTRNGTSTGFSGGHPSNETMNRDYYDPSKHPPHVSQQTSESSVRDMALRKGIQQLSEKSSFSSLTALPSKTNMKYWWSAGKQKIASDEPWREKRLDLMSLLTPPKTPVEFTSPPGTSYQSPPKLKDAPYFSSEETVHAQVQRKGSKLRLEMDRKIKPLPREPGDIVAREKVFDSDIYSAKKTHVRRPPKGAKNWFDGLDISSDEEEPEPAGFLPSELPANELPQMPEALPSVFSPYGTPMPAFPVPYQDGLGSDTEREELPVRTSKESKRQRKLAQNTQRSLPPDEASPTGDEDQSRGGESRLAHSRLDTESVLSLSSDSGEDEVVSTPQDEAPRANNAVVLEKAASMEIQRPSMPVRQIDGASSEEQIRRQHSLKQHSKPPQRRLSEGASPPPIPKRGPSLLSDSSNIARRRQDAFLASPVQSVPSKHTPRSPRRREAPGSAGGDTISSSVPTELSRMMAVTEEEMMLLELMRQKRAAMQKDSFTEGYRSALSEDQRHPAYRHEPMQDPALMSLGRRVKTPVKRRDSSKVSDLTRDEIELRLRMNAIRNEDVDEAFKMQRFLSTEQENWHGPPAIEKFLAGEFGGRPISGTEIETESRYSAMEDLIRDTSSFEEQRDTPLVEQTRGIKVDRQPGEATALRSPSLREPSPLIEMNTPRPAQSFSPMQRLTDRVRTASDRSIGSNGSQTKDVQESAETQVQADEPIFSSEPPTPILDQDELNSSTPALLEQTQTGEQSIVAQSEEKPRVESPGIPVATTWARVSGIKQPQPQRQPNLRDLMPTETSSQQSSQANSPTVASKRASELTAFITALRASGQQTSAISHAHNSSISSDPSDGGSYMPEPLKSHPPGVGPKSPKRGLPPNLRPKIPGRITSMASITSAGEEVLASWTELGGSESLAFRRKNKP